ncbi:MAG: hypothetical protein OEV42_20440, partial [Deltaproteobacteria bacterium]|nr:hypothetical protein [Deltaproteobacteria bacterium]
DGSRSSAVPTDNQVWTSLTNGTATAFPYTVVNGITDVRVTIVAKTGNTNGSQNQLWVDDVSITYTPPLSGDTLTVDANTPVASAVTEGESNVQMQYLTVSCDNVDDGSCEITSVTVDDIGTVAAGDLTNLKVHFDSDNNFGNGVDGTATVAAWDGTPVVVNTSTTAGRTVTNAGGAKYIWITYDVAGGSAGKKVQSSITAIGVAAPDSGPSGTWNSNGPITISSTPTDTLSVNANTTVATVATEGDTDLEMQYLTVSCDNVQDGSCEIISVTVDDTGTAGAGDFTNLKVHFDSDNNFGNGVDGTATVAAWNGTSTAVDTSAVAGRTVTNAGGSKYIWITYDLAGGSAGKTIRSQITAVSVAAPDGGAIGTWNANSMTIASTPKDTLTVNANTPVAVSAAATEVKVQMQYLTVSCDNVQDGSCEIISVTVDDLGTAGAGDFTNLKVHFDSDTDFGNGVDGTATVAAWTAASTVVDTSAAGGRTVTNAGGSKYIWITYDLAGSAEAKTIRSSVTAIGLASPDVGASGTWNSNGPITVAAAPLSPYKVTLCSDCHDYPPKDGSARNVPEGAVLGSHSTHVKKVGVLCVECHGNTTTGETNLAHRNTFIQFTSALKNGGSYSKGASFAQSNNPVPGTCTAYCHGANMATGATGAVAAPTWGNSATVYCGSCHKELQTNMTQGSHAKHLTLPNNINCFFCHASNLDTTHVNASVTFKDTSTLSTTSVCASCHNGGAPEAKFDWYSTVATQTCDTCHLTTGDVDDFSYTNLTSATKVVAKIDTTEFSGRGHGKTGGSYDYTGNPAANKVCTNCHDSTVNHNDGSNAFRTLWSGDPDTFCLGCHGSGAQLQGAFATITGIQNHSRTNIQNAGYNNVTTWRFIPKCIDCHDPHGDNNIGMIHNKIFTGGSNALGIPNPFVNASTVIFSKYTGTNSFGDDTGNTNVCEVCHSRTAFHRLDHSMPAHNNGLDCTGCHDHKAGWAPLGGDCKTCHGQAQTGVYNPRQIVGAGGDFVKLSRHVSDGTATEIVTNYDCAVCHAEGDVTAINAGTGWKSSTYHNDGSTSTDRMVSLRNVDNIAAAPYEFNKNAVNESMRTAMDNFCMGCHDVDGASDITVNSTNDGLDTGGSVTRNLTPFNTNDAVTNGNDLMGTRTRVVDVKSQFFAGSGGSGAGYNGNPSQHAVLGARYSAKHSDTNAGQWDTLAWTNHSYRNGAVANVAKETATLHCSDCHLSESNAHGATNAWYMLQNGTPNDYTTDYAMEGIIPKNDVTASTDIGESMVCWKCHSPAVYSGNGINDATVSRTDHSDDGGGWFDVSDFGGKVSQGAYLGPACLLCHSGDGFGRIHGRGSATDGDNGQYTPNGGTGSFTKYRFMPGAWNAWQPGTDDTAWNGPKTGDTGCYLPASSSWTACGQHSNGSKTGNAATINYARPVKY